MLINTENSPMCAFEKPEALCAIAQSGVVCRIFTECAEANKGGDMTPAEFCKENPGWTISAALVFRKSRMVNNPQDQTPLKSAHNRFRELPSFYGNLIKEKLKKEFAENVGHPYSAPESIPAKNI